MHRTLNELIAESLDADTALLPHVSTLLADLNALGGDPEMAVRLIESTGDAPGRMLDLGCGKGALAIALAERGWDCTGIDGYAPFIESARFGAEMRGLCERCRFIVGDLRDHTGADGAYDLVTLCGVGPYAGGHARTIGAIRSLVRPGGLILLEDGYLATGAAAAEAEEFVGYAQAGATRGQLTAHGDSIIFERVVSEEETRRASADILARIRPRAEALIRSKPELEDAVRAYLREQDRQNELLGRVLIPAMWLLRRSD